MKIQIFLNLLLQKFKTLPIYAECVFSFLINWTSPFPILGLFGGIFQSNLKRNFCLQTVENLIRHLILLHLIWFCTVCRCPTKRRVKICSFPIKYHINVLKISNNFLFLISSKILNIKAGIPKILVGIANRKDPDQTASSEAVCSGSALFVMALCLKF